MTVLHRCLPLVALFFSIWAHDLWAQSPSSKTDAREVIDQMQAYYDSVQKFSANFEQTVTDISGLEQHRSGIVWFMKPGRMRWDYQKPEPKYIISNGKTLWIWEPHYLQYCEQPLEHSQLPTALTFLSGQGKISKDFNAHLVLRNAEKIRVQLIPKKSSPHYTQIVFDLNPKDFSVLQVIVFDALGNQNAIRFEQSAINNAEENLEIQASHFEFTPPPNARELCGRYRK